MYVAPNTSPQRRRFSTGHELGHWHHHRGIAFVCRSSDIGRPIDEKSRDAERLADAYAGDLILPPFMVGPKLERLGEISLDGIADEDGGDIRLVPSHGGPTTSVVNSRRSS